MTDITKCKGDNCPVRLKCFRFNSAPSPLYQSFFLETPGKKIKGKFTCEYFYKRFDEDYSE